MDYGRAIRTCRALRGWQQERVAERAGLSKSYVSLIEAGLREPSHSALKRLSSALMVPESLLVLLASDLRGLPLADSRTYDQVARSLLSLLVEASSDSKR